MNFKKTLLTILAASLIGVTGCSSKPKIKKVADLTGDGIADVLLRDSGATWLFIGKKEGGYIRTRRYCPEKDGVELFMTDSGKTYFFDGIFYKQFISP